MKEAIGRRFARLGDAERGRLRRELRGRCRTWSWSTAARPQLSAALEAIGEASETERVAVVSLAKREEEVFVPGRPSRCALDRHSPGLQLLQRLRDEAHRFAIGYHRQRRSSESFASLFDELRGVGPGADGARS